MTVWPPALGPVFSAAVQQVIIPYNKKFAEDPCIETHVLWLHVPYVHPSAMPAWRWRRCWTYKTVFPPDHAVSTVAQALTLASFL